jgi:hypothetical protein
LTFSFSSFFSPSHEHLKSFGGPQRQKNGSKKKDYTRQPSACFTTAVDAYKGRLAIQSAAQSLCSPTLSVIAFLSFYSLSQWLKGWEVSSTAIYLLPFDDPAEIGRPLRK